MSPEIVGPLSAAVAIVLSVLASVFAAGRRAGGLEEKLGRIEEKVDTMWKIFVIEPLRRQGGGPARGNPGGGGHNPGSDHDSGERMALAPAIEERVRQVTLENLDLDRIDLITKVMEHLLDSNAPDLLDAVKKNENGFPEFVGTVAALVDSVVEEQKAARD